MNNKIIYAICLVICATGISLYIVAHINSEQIAADEEKLTEQVKDLEAVLKHKKTDIRLDWLKFYQTQIDAHVAESQKINDFFVSYRDNLNTFFKTNLGEQKNWKVDSQNRAVPTGGNFQPELHSQLKRLSKKYETILRIPSEEQSDKDVSLTFSGDGDGSISPLRGWQGAPPPDMIFPVMQKYNVASTICETISKIKGGPRLKSISVAPFIKIADANEDFDRLKISLGCELEKKSVTNLVTALLKNPKFLFDVRKLSLGLPSFIDDDDTEVEITDRLDLTIDIDVLLIKDEIATERAKKVTIKQAEPAEKKTGTRDTRWMGKYYGKNFGKKKKPKKSKKK